MSSPNPPLSACRLLIVEDNPDLLANLYGYLEPLGYVIDSATNGFSGLSMASDGGFDVIVLDVMLPGLDGIALCQRLRSELRRDTPVLMLTARDTVEDRVLGLRSGADDYLVKPFSMVELEARLQALVRRAQGRGTNAVLQVGPLRFDPQTFEAYRGGRRIELTPTGYRLLAALLRAAPRVVTRAALEHAVWGDDPPASDALRSHLHALRQALDKPFDQAMLVTVQGVGYRLVDSDAS
ncbi:MAG: response regulator transcription factor [Hydrogenophaga sp.]